MLLAFVVKRRVLFQQKENVELLIVFENRKVVDITTIKQKKFFLTPLSNQIGFPSVMKHKKEEYSLSPKSNF